MKDLEAIKEELPEDAMISEAKYEGSDIVFYTKNRDFLLNNEDTVKKLVAKLKKRIEIRPAASISLDPEKAEKKIKEIVPKEASLKEIIFQPDFGKVILSARKPGLVIGKNGETLTKIKHSVRWMPVIQRVPAIESKIVDKARELTVGNSEFRKVFLNKVGEHIRIEKTKVAKWLRLTALGGFRQVGRSCILVHTDDSKVLLDCGIDAAGTNSGTYPYLNVPEVDLKNLDAVIVSHAHMDHCGFVPYLYEYGYEGPVYCTEPTRDLMILLQLDYIDVTQSEGKKAPYTSKAIKKEIERCITINYGEVTDITPDMRLTLNNAGHILGSASVHLHVGEGLHNIIYTGDYKFGSSQLLDRANPRFNRVETLITESTYGYCTEPLPKPFEAGNALMKAIESTLKNKGKVLIPVFSVGRAQEVMVLLAEQKLDVPVHIDGMIYDATALHTAYPEFLSRKIQQKIFHENENPFLSESFHRIGGMKEREEVIMGGPSIILSTSGMLTGGPVLTYLEHLGENKNNRMIFVGYQAAGTLGDKIKKGWRQIVLNGDKKVDINMKVDTVEGFSAHSDRSQIINYVSKLPNRPNKILCNHGDNSSTFMLASALHKIFNVETAAPQNLETIRLV